MPRVAASFKKDGSVVLSLFAVALAGTGLLTTVGVIVSMDTFGPVSDNAQGIAEMSGDVTGEGAVILTKLDAVGNTTKAITKGIAIATAVLAATALFGAFRETVTAAALEAGQSASGAMSTMDRTSRSDSASSSNRTATRAATSPSSRPALTTPSWS